MEDKNIDYPAAYVVNGESGSISVIDLNTNAVSETIELMGTDDKMVMWPHHLSGFSIFNMHRLVIGVPGADLSAGHSGGMDNMKGQILVKDKILKARHDTEKVSATDAVYEKLPGCCQYDRQSAKSTPQHDHH